MDATLNTLTDNGRKRTGQSFEDANAPAVADVLAGVLRDLEKQLLVLEKHLLTLEVRLNRK